MTAEGLVKALYCSARGDFSWQADALVLVCNSETTERSRQPKIEIAFRIFLEYCNQILYKPNFLEAIDSLCEILLRTFSAFRSGPNKV